MGTLPGPELFRDRAADPTIFIDIPYKGLELPM